MSGVMDLRLPFLSSLSTITAPRPGHRAASAPKDATLALRGAEERRTHQRVRRGRRQGLGADVAQVGRSFDEQTANDDAHNNRRPALERAAPEVTTGVWQNLTRVGRADIEGCNVPRSVQKLLRSRGAPRRRQFRSRGASPGLLQAAGHDGNSEPRDRRHAGRTLLPRAAPQQPGQRLPAGPSTKMARRWCYDPDTLATAARGVPWPALVDTTALWDPLSRSGGTWWCGPCRCPP